MGISAVTKRNAAVKQFVLFKPTVIVHILKLGIWTNGLTPQCSENMQLPLILKGETDAYYQEEIIGENPAVVIQYLNGSLDALAPQEHYLNSPFL